MWIISLASRGRHIFLLLGLLVYGITTSSAHAEQLGVSTLFAARGPSSSDSFAVSGDYYTDRYLPGDLNGDGTPDLVVGSTTADSLQGADDNHGMLRVLSGKNGSALFDMRGDYDGNRLSSGSVHYPGDLNGDGVPDILASTYGKTSDSDTDNVGELRAYSGSNGAVLFTSSGLFKSDYFATFKVGLPGDINNDGVPDIVASAGSGDSSNLANDNVGYVRLISGRDGNAIFTVFGTAEKSYLGSAGFAFPGDLNGDGTSDIIAHYGYAQSPDGEKNYVGMLRAISGSNGATIFEKFGDFTSDYLAVYAPLAPGDLNGDGVTDIVVGSYGADTSEGANDSKGLVRAFSGANGTILYNVRGTFSNDLLGLGDLLSLGDVNGDGINDILINIYSADSSEGADDNVGGVRAISGSTGATLWEVRGSFSDDYFGYTRKIIGDLNGDGIDDLLVGSSTADSAEGADDDVGVVKAISGSSGSVLYTLSGTFAQDKYSSAGVYFPGDLNSDGTPDFIVASQNADSAAGLDDDVGKVQLVSGVDGTILFTVQGPFAGDKLGGYITLGGDLSGDGIPDIIAVAYEADSSAGADDNVGLVRGISGSDGSILFDIRGDFANDEFGLNDVYVPGDLNGDSVADIVVATYKGDSASGADDDVGLIKAFTLDQCPDDSNKASAGTCGCGVADLDENENGIIDCLHQQELKDSVTTLQTRVKRVKFRKLKKADNQTLKNLLTEIKSLSARVTEASADNNSIQKLVKKANGAVNKLRKAAKKPNKAAFNKKKKKAMKAIKKLLNVL